MDSFVNRLYALGSEAFDTVKNAFKKAGVTAVYLEKPNATLHIDSCDNYGCIYQFDPHFVYLLDGNTIVITADDNADSPDDCSPRRYWCEGGDTYAEWDDLFEIFDQVLRILQYE